MSSAGEWIEETIKKEINEMRTTILPNIGEYLVARIKGAYGAQEMEGPELAPATVKRKGSTRKLIDKGKMVASFRYEMEGNTLHVGSDYMADEIGMSLAEIHEHGTRRIPARPLLKVTFEKEEKKIESMLVGSEKF